MGKWEMVRLGKAATYINGFAFKPSDWTDKGLPIIRIQNLTGSSEVINYYNKPYDNRYEINDGDILISWSASLGVYEWSKGKALLNQHIFKVIFDKLKYNKRFFMYVISQKLDEMVAVTHGSTMKHITKKYFDAITIPFPPFPIQQQIADVLDCANALIEKRKAQIEKLDLLIKSKFIEMFGDPIVNPNDWPIIGLPEFYGGHDEAVKCGPFGSALKKEEYVNLGIPVWTMDNITKQGDFIDEPYLHISEQKYSDLKVYSVKQHDIIISRAGTVGKMCVVNSKHPQSIISTNLIRLRLNKQLLPLYFVMLIQIWGNRVCRFRTGSDGAFTHMNTGVLNSIHFPYPPIPLQNEFAVFVEQVEAQKSLLQQSLEKLELNYKSLMQKCFRGDIF